MNSGNPHIDQCMSALESYEETVRLLLVRGGSPLLVVNQVCQGIERRSEYFNAVAQEVLTAEEGTMQERLLEYYVKINGWLLMEVFLREVDLAELQYQTRSAESKGAALG